MNNRNRSFLLIAVLLALLLALPIAGTFALSDEEALL